MEHGVFHMRRKKPASSRLSSLMDTLRMTSPISTRQVSCPVLLIFSRSPCLAVHCVPGSLTPGSYRRLERCKTLLRIHHGLAVCFGVMKNAPVNLNGRSCPGVLIGAATWEASLLNVCDKVPSNVAFLGGPVMPNQVALLLVWVCEARRPADFVRFAHIGKRTWRQAFSTRVIFTHILLFDPRGFLFSTALILRIPDHEQVKGLQ